MRNMIKAVVIKSNGKRHRTKALLRWKDSTKKENNYQTEKSEDENELLFENSKRMDYSKLADNIGLGHRE